MQCHANYNIDAAQMHNRTFNLWMPYSGTGTGRGYDEYRVRSSYAGGLTTNYSFPEREKFCDTLEKTEFIRKYTTEYLKVRPYFSEDFYPLSEVTSATDAWCVTQFNRRENKDGLLQVFVREHATYEIARFILKGLDENAEYLFTDIDGGEFSVSGKELVSKGLKLTVLEKRKAKIYLYKAL